MAPSKLRELQHDYRRVIAWFYVVSNGYGSLRTRKHIPGRLVTSTRVRQMVDACAERLGIINPSKMTIARLRLLGTEPSVASDFRELHDQVCRQIRDAGLNTTTLFQEALWNR